MGLFHRRLFMTICQSVLRTLFSLRYWRGGQNRKLRLPPSQRANLQQTVNYQRRGYTQAYTSKRRILIQVLPPPNVYTKSANACIKRCGRDIWSHGSNCTVLMWQRTVTVRKIIYAVPIFTATTHHKWWPLPKPIVYGVASLYSAAPSIDSMWRLFTTIMIASDCADEEDEVRWH